MHFIKFSRKCASMNSLLVQVRRDFGKGVQHSGTGLSGEIGSCVRGSGKITWNAQEVDSADKGRQLEVERDSLD